MDCLSDTSQVLKVSYWSHNTVISWDAIWMSVVLSFLNKSLFNSTLSSYWTPNIILQILTLHYLMKNCSFLEGMQIFWRNGLMRGVPPRLSPVRNFSHHIIQYLSKYHIHPSLLEIYLHITGSTWYTAYRVRSVPQCGWKLVSVTSILCKRIDAEAVYNW